MGTTYGIVSYASKRRAQAYREAAEAVRW